MRRQIYLENELMQNANEILISDTNLLESKVFTKEYYGGFVEDKLDKVTVGNRDDIYFLMHVDTLW